MRDMIKKENKLCFQHRMERKPEKSFQLSAGRQRLLAETIIVAAVRVIQAVAIMAAIIVIILAVTLRRHS